MKTTATIFSKIETLGYFDFDGIVFQKTDYDFAINTSNNKGVYFGKRQTVSKIELK